MLEFLSCWRMWGYDFIVYRKNFIFDRLMFWFDREIWFMFSFNCFVCVNLNLFIGMMGCLFDWIFIFLIFVEDRENIIVIIVMIRKKNCNIVIICIINIFRF